MMEIYKNKTTHKCWRYSMMIEKREINPLPKMQYIMVSPITSVVLMFQYKSSLMLKPNGPPLSIPIPLHFKHAIILRLPHLLHTP